MFHSSVNPDLTAMSSGQRLSSNLVSNDINRVELEQSNEKFHLLVRFSFSSFVLLVNLINENWSSKEWWWLVIYHRRRDDLWKTKYVDLLICTCRMILLSFMSRFLFFLCVMFAIGSLYDKKKKKKKKKKNWNITI